MNPDPVLQYATDVVDGREIAGPLVRLACRRHLHDLETGESRGLWWDQPGVDRVFGFFRDVLRLAGGEFEGKPFILAPPQQFIVGSLFGWRKEDQRRFRTAYVEIGKGGGKSPLAAGIGLYMFSADGEARAEVFAAATDKDQARIIFRDAVAMVDQSPALARRILKSPKDSDQPDRVWNMAHLSSGSFFRPISSESRGRGKSGFRPYCVLLDEIHEHPTDAMVEFMRKNIKGRPNALVLMITNSGVNDPNSVCLRYHNYSAQVLNGATDDSFFGYVCGLDEHDDWTDPAVWKKSNPMLGVSVRESYLEEEVRQSIGMPSRQSLTQRLNFCMWVDSVNPFIASEVWSANADAPNGPQRCFGGLDLSQKNDLSALVLSCEDGSVLPFFFTPKDGLRQREERDRAPYAQWVREGNLIAVPGKTIDYRYIAQKVGELQKQGFQIESIAFDTWKSDDMIAAFDAEGVDIKLIPHGQGFRDMTRSIQALEDSLLEKRLKHGNHPVLTWCINNTQVTPDPAGNRKFDKRKATGRIDGAVALAMAEGLRSTTNVEPKFQMMFFG